MKPTDIVILLIIVGIIYSLYKNECLKKKTAKLRRHMKVNPSDFSRMMSIKDRKEFPPYDMDTLLNPQDIDFQDNSQYHPDYVEVLAVINKYRWASIFNLANIPVLRVVEAEKRDVYPWANKFIFSLSRKSGVGLRLVDIIRVMKFITEDQTKLQFDLVLQKETPVPTRVKMILRVSLVFDYNTANETDFFKAHTSWYRLTPKLDEAFIVGFTTGYYDIASEATTQYYSFSNLENDQYFDPETIRKVVRRKKLRSDMETSCLNTLWDEDGRNYYGNNGGDKYFETLGTTIVENQ